MGKSEEHIYASGADDTRLRSIRRALMCAASFSLLVIPTLAHAQTDDSPTTKSERKKKIDEQAAADIVVTGVNAPTTTSTGLPLKFMETPQSVTIIDQKRIQDYALTNIRDLLDQVVGVNVDRGETDRTSFEARGFDVTNFQIDGIGLPLITNQFYGDTDSFLYDRIDIIRGASGLTTGIGNPSATVNYVRKRPLNGFHVNAAIYGGSWNRWRGEADVSIPVNDKLAVRVIGAHEEGDWYLDNYHLNRDVYGISMAGKITPDLTLTVGYMRQDNRTKGATWGSLTLFYSDGSPIPYKRSDSPAPPFSGWPLRDQQAYGELAYKTGDWQIRSVFTFRRYQDWPEIDYQYGFPDKVTGQGYYGDIARFQTDDKRYYADLMANGTVHALGREHKLTFGVSYGYDRLHGLQSTGNAAYPYPDYNDPDRFNIPEPDFPPFTESQNAKAKLLRLYVASQINLTDRLHAVVGTSWSKYDAPGINFGATLSTKANKFNPYAGVLYDITSFLTAYASYTTIFSPQIDQKIDRTQVAPLTGTNIEAGLKANILDKRLYLTATAFQAKEKNLSTYAGQASDQFGQYYYYVGQNIRSKGIELEAVGHIVPDWAVSGGFTTINLRNLSTHSQGRTFIPRQTFKASTTYTIPDLHNLSVGAQFRWQSHIYADVDAFPGTRVNQKAYGVLDLMAGIDVIKNLRASINVRNVTNKLYYASLLSGQYANAFYAPGRNFTASLAYRF